MLLITNGIEYYMLRNYNDYTLYGAPENNDELYDQMIRLYQMVWCSIAQYMHNITIGK